MGLKHLISLAPILLLTAVLALPPAASAESRVRLVVTGNLMGALKECRCPHGQPGGLARRKTIFDRLRAETPDAVFIDCGKIIRKDTDSSEIVLFGRLMMGLDYDLICGYIVDYEALAHAGFDVEVLPFNFANLEWIRIVDSLPNPFSASIKERRDSYKLSRTRIIKSSDTNLLFFTGTQFDDQPDSIAIAYKNAWFHPRFGQWTYRLRELDPRQSKLDLEQFPGFIIIVRNEIGLGEDEEEGLFNTTAVSARRCPGLDLMLVGGGGFVEAEVTQQDGLLVAYPGLYGGYVLVIDLWTEDGRSVSRFEWEAIPTENAKPDPGFQTEIDGVYTKQEGSK